MNTPNSLEKFYVGWSGDGRTYQLLGLYEADNAQSAVDEAARNHKQLGNYLVMPDDKITVFNVPEGEWVPVINKMTEEQIITPDSPPPPAA